MLRDKTLVGVYMYRQKNAHITNVQCKLLTHRPCLFLKNQPSKPGVRALCGEADFFALEWKRPGEL